MDGPSPSFLWTEPTTQGRTSTEPAEIEGLPAEIGIWIFVLGDMTIFGAFFVTFLVEARQHQPAFVLAAGELARPLGLLNTVVLLTSSLIVALALAAHRGSNVVKTRRLLLAAAVCGGIFGVVKAFEYSLEISHAHAPGTGLFFTFYFVLTGVHLLHVLIGTGLVLAWRSRTQRIDGWTPNRRFAETAAIYWHMVDLLWVVIFALLYLVYLR